MRLNPTDKTVAKVLVRGAKNRKLHTKSQNTAVSGRLSGTGSYLKSDGKSEIEYSKYFSSERSQKEKLESERAKLFNIVKFTNFAD